MMKIQYGILKNQKIRDFFNKEINSRKLCPECRKKREERGLADKDKKWLGHYSNLLPGFSSSKVTMPIDILIIAEAHGGGGNRYFRQECDYFRQDLNQEVASIGGYYLAEEINKFHQSEMRKLFRELDRLNKTWVFADLVRCYVYQSQRKKEKENWMIATKYCQEYLRKEINFLQPKIIICLGDKVALFIKNFLGFREEFERGRKYEVKLNDNKITIIRSYFPSKNTADLWVANRGWDSVIARLKNN